MTAEMIKKHLPPPSADAMVFVCGPPPMVKMLAGAKNPDYSQGPITGMLSELGYTSANVFKF